MGVIQESTSWDHRVLGAEELAQASQVGERLQGELRGIFERLPPQARSGLGLARFGGIDRGTATRFVAVCGKMGEGLDVLRQSPGVRGLRQILEALGKRGIPRAELAGASAAVERFERLIAEHGGSQAKLCERVAASRARGTPRDPAAHERVLLARRRNLFEAASEAIGQRMDLNVTCHAFRPSPGKAGFMDQAMLRGAFGYRARKDAPTYAIRSYGRNDGAGAEVGDRAYHALEQRGAGDVPEETVFRGFSTDPLPLVTARGVGQESLVVVDAERVDEHVGLDVVLGRALLENWRLPALDNPPTHDISTHVSVPCARMVFDVFLHRSMARQCVPTMRLYRTTPGLFHDLAGHWPDLLPHAPSLQIMGPSAHPAGSRMYGRHGELLGEFFERVKWLPEEFVGYRVEVEHPMWCGFYCIMFDYGGEAG